MKLYAERDIMAQGQTYCDHVNQMTAEGLHAKSDIAAELAHRDIEIERLRKRLQEIEVKASAFVSIDPRANNFAKWLQLVASTADMSTGAQT